MVKYLLLFLFVIQSFFSYSQQTTDETKELVNILPPSPSAGELGRYAAVGSNISTGALSSSIDLYTYSTKNLKLPISINYSTTGFKVDQISTRVGQSWSLNAGGAITRTVLGNPDGGSFANPPSDWPNTTGQALDSYIQSVVAADYDTQPDIFSYNFLNYSGRFIVVNGVIKKLEQNDLDIVGTISGGFTITTADGVKFLFNVKESSTSINSANPHYRDGITNAWYLKSITHPFGDVITLSYGFCEFNYLGAVSQIYTFFRSADANYQTPLPNAETPKQNEYITQIKNNGVYLIGITSNAPDRGNLKMNYLPRQDLSGDYLLNNIELYEKDNSAPLKTISFGYSYSTYNGFSNSYTNLNPLYNVQKRLFLNSLQIGEKNYRFFYNDLDKLPPRVSYAQDHYGYFNGKSNSSLIPTPAQQYIHAAPAFKYGDRRPDWNFAKRGLLRKIVYPTGGQDSIEYEANTIYVNQDKDCDIPTETLSPSISGESTFKHSTTYYSDPFVVTCDQTVQANISCLPLSRASDGSPSYPNGEYSVTACIMNTATSSCVASLSAAVDNSNVISFVLPEGNYQIRLTVGGDASGLVSFTVKNSYPFTGNKDIAGLRIKRIISFDPLTQKENVKKFYYGNLSTNQSSGKVFSQHPLYKSSYATYLRGSTWCEFMTKIYDKMSSSNSYGLNDLTGNHIYYDQVFESSGENFDNGGVEHIFLNVFDSNGAVMQGNPIPGASMSNFGINSHLELEKNTFSYTNGVISYRKKIKTVYTDDPRLRSRTTYYVLQADGGYQSVCNFYSLPNYIWLSIANYDMLSSWVYPSAVETTEFDQNGVNPVITTINYEYNNASHLQLTKETSTGSDGKVKTSYSTYPSDYASGTIFIDNLLTNKILDVPIENVVVLSDGSNYNILSGVLNYYTTNGKGLVESVHFLETTSPITLSNFKFSNSLAGQLPNWNSPASFAADPKYKERISFTYNASNNPEDIINDGIKKSYMWGYSSQFPTVEIQNGLLGEMGYSSFESSEMGNLSYSNAGISTAFSRTGSKSFNFSSASNIISKSGLTNESTYKVSYWTRSASPYTVIGTIGNPTQGSATDGWTFYEHLVTGQSSVNITATSGYIDDIRIYPKNAQVTTFTYKPLTGMTSSTDARNKTTFYEYDEFQRLKNIRDQQKFIIKNYRYSYLKESPVIDISWTLTEGQYPFFVDNNLTFNVNGVDVENEFNAGTGVFKGAHAGDQVTIRQDFYSQAYPWPATGADATFTVLINGDPVKNVSFDTQSQQYYTFTIEEGKTYQVISTTKNKAVRINYSVSQSASPYLDNNLFIEVNGGDVIQEFWDNNTYLDANVGDQVRFKEVFIDPWEPATAPKANLTVKKDGVVIYNNTVSSATNQVYPSGTPLTLEAEKQYEVITTSVSQ
ncbi:hypothetical protein [Rubrolithibacter danxiaensis]|uniref:hypothetical protein n=1 Tax=Rubrolithibacter danxiaensis TaxID=3390805 RepID=UPI003BF8032A